MTTSTAKAADVLSRLEFLLDTAWPDLRVAVTSVSDEWAAMSVAGPKSRDILAAAFPDLDVSNEALPHMGLLDAEFDGRALRILRLSYSGERAYEVYVGATAGEKAWARLLEAGAPFGLKPYGVEALGALRVEKGHVAGPEIDGRTTLDDLGLGRMVGKRIGFVGDVMRHRPAFKAPDRQRLVGLECIEEGKRLRGGAILFLPGEKAAGHGRGRVTSVTFSPELGRYVGLALLAGDVAVEGSEVIAVYPMKAKPCAPASSHPSSSIRKESACMDSATSSDFDLSAADCPIIQIEGWDGTLERFEASLSQELGMALPALVGETVRHADTLIVRVAPRRFWLISEDGAEVPSPAVDPELGCSVSLSEGRVRFRMTGARVPEVLSACIAVDWYVTGGGSMAAPCRRPSTAYRCFCCGPPPTHAIFWCHAALREAWPNG